MQSGPGLVAVHRTEAHKDGCVDDAADTKRRCRVRGSRHSGSVQNSVRLAMAPLRLASHSGKPAPEKIDEKESPMTIVYWRDCEAQRKGHE